MEFSQTAPIYQQIADRICENILSGRWKEGERIPSIRELAVDMEVNPNTVMRTYTYLQEQGVIQNQRGIGYFAADNAVAVTRELARTDFESRELPRIFRTMDLLGISADDIRVMYENWRKGEDR
jgi:GntR family transcriptional regulator